MTAWHRYLPFLRWFPLTVNTLRMDFLAGITVALVLIPQSMAYAHLAGLPPYYGLYAAFIPSIIAALWGSSKQLATGPVAVVSLLTASALTPFAEIASEQFVSLAVLLALLVGMIQFVVGAFKLGAIMNFLSQPVIVGFTNAAAMIIGLSQLNQIFGVDKPHSDSFLVDIWSVFLNVSNTHMFTLIMGVFAFTVMWIIKKYFPRYPGVLVAVLLSTLFSYLIGFEAAGGKVVGTIPAGLPDIRMPQADLSLGLFWSLLTSAAVISLVAFTEAISIAKAMAAKTRDRLDPNQELIGQGLANIVGSFFQSYAVSGSFSRSAVNLNAGAVTGMSAVFTGVIVLITLLFFTPLLYHLPSAVLAAVIIMAVIGLVNFKIMRHAWRVNKHDGIAAVLTFVATFGFAPHLEYGILVGAGTAICLYLYRTMSPRVAILGRYEDGTLRDVRVHNLPTDDRIVAIRFDGSLYFANVSYFEDSILDACADNPDVKYVLVVSDGINQLDASGEEVLHHLVTRLQSAGITMVFSGLKKQVLAIMQATNLYAQIGAQNVFATEDMALEDIYEWLEDGGDEDNEKFCPLKPGAKAGGSGGMGNDIKLLG